MMKLSHYNGVSPLEMYLIQVQLGDWFSAWLVEETGVQVAFAIEGKALQVVTDLQPTEPVRPIFAYVACCRSEKESLGAWTICGL